MNAGSTLDQRADARTIVLNCGAERAPEALASLPTVTVPPRPGRTDIDPLLNGVHRLVVVGGTDSPDADLAAVLTRLLRTEHLDIELAYVAARPTAATRVWGLPTGADAALAAERGIVRPVPLVRDDTGQALAGQAILTGVDGGRLAGESYVDSMRLFAGEVPRVVIEPGADGLRARVPRRWRHRWLAGRAIQIGSTGLRVSRDGHPQERVVQRTSFYRHSQDWLLVR